MEDSDSLDEFMEMEANLEKDELKSLDEFMEMEANLEIDELKLAIKQNEMVFTGFRDIQTYLLMVRAPSLPIIIEEEPETAEDDVMELSYKGEEQSDGSETIFEERWCYPVAFPPCAVNAENTERDEVQQNGGSGAIFEERWCYPVTFPPCAVDAEDTERDEVQQNGGSGAIFEERWCYPVPFPPCALEAENTERDEQNGGSGAIFEERWCYPVPFPPWAAEAENTEINEVQVGCFCLKNMRKQLQRLVRGIRPQRLVRGIQNILNRRNRVRPFTE